MTAPAPLYADVSCSQCGHSFGPGEHGFSHCYQHKGFARDIEEIRQRLQNEAGRLGSLVEDINPRWSTPAEIDDGIRLCIEQLRAVRRLAQDAGRRK